MDFAELTLPESITSSEMLFQEQSSQKFGCDKEINQFCQQSSRSFIELSGNVYFFFFKFSSSQKK